MMSRPADLPAVAPDPRFAGIDRLYGAGTVARLAGMHVAVVGLGGVGSWAAEALVRSGVGRLTCTRCRWTEAGRCGSST